MDDNFNPRPPCGGRHIAARPPESMQKFQSTSSVWRTTGGSRWRQSMIGISIHVLRVEDDHHMARVPPLFLHFNPRPPCGGRPDARIGGKIVHTFQSTSSVWRTTRCILPPKGGTGNFNPRPPCGGRRCSRAGGRKWAGFQSTSSVWRTTLLSWVFCQISPEFQSTSSVWRTTLVAVALLGRVGISIHVLRVEDDEPLVTQIPNVPHFNPRPPCGGRLAAYGWKIGSK